MSNKKTIIKKNFKSLIKSKKMRRRSEARSTKDTLFYLLSISAISITLLIMSTIVFGVVKEGCYAFVQTKILLTINPNNQQLSDADTQSIIHESLAEYLGSIENPQDKINQIISTRAQEEIKHAIAHIKTNESNHNVIQIWITAVSKIDMFLKGKIEAEQIDSQIREVITNLKKHNLIKFKFNKTLFIASDSSRPEQAGLLGATIGSLMMLLICLVTSAPIGILTGIYLQEFAPHNKITHLIKINIYNLASTPAIVFGLLGSYIYLEVLGLPRSSALIGGLTLGLVMLPITIVTTKQAIKNTPKSVKNAALALGASHSQALLHHTLPLALPEIITGIILATAKILGETSPLLVIGMVIFTSEIPQNFTDASNSLSTQIYLWFKNADTGFVSLTSAAIIVLVLIVALLNVLASVIKNRFSKF